MDECLSESAGPVESPSGYGQDGGDWGQRVEGTVGESDVSNRLCIKSDQRLR